MPALKGFGFSRTEKACNQRRLQPLGWESSSKTTFSAPVFKRAVIPRHGGARIEPTAQAVGSRTTRVQSRRGETTGWSKEAIPKKA